MRVFIDNPSHVVGSKTRDKIEVADVVMSNNHVVFLSNVFPRLISLLASAIFISRTRGIMAILKYRDVNPIDLNFILVFRGTTESMTV